MSRAAIPVNPICVERIRAERKALNVTQAELAKRLGISEQSLRKYELGQRGVSEWIIGLMANVFGCSARYLSGESNFRPDAEEEEAKTNVGEILENYNSIRLQAEKKDCAISDFLRLFFSCEIRRMDFGEKTILTFNGQEATFKTRDEWEAFCVDFVDDVQKVFKYHLYERIATQRANNEK